MADCPSPDEAFVAGVIEKLSFRDIRRLKANAPCSSGAVYCGWYHEMPDLQHPNGFLNETGLAVRHQLLRMESGS